MPVVKVTRAGVRSAPREVPTETTATVMPMTLDRVGEECPEDEGPTKVSSLAEAFEKFTPKVDFKTNVGEEGTEFVAELDFKSLKDFDPKQIRSREPGKRNDIADLQSQIDLLHRMRERFTLLARLATRIAEATLDDERVDAVTVSVRKLDPPVPQQLTTSGVRITRVR